MKPHLLFAFALAGASLVWAQSSTTTSMKDINGRRVDDPTVTSAGTSSAGARTERSQSINGRQVPLEETVDRVLRDDGNSKTTERIVRKFAPNGQLAGTERVLIEETKLPGGGSSVRETISRNDVNGRFQEAERRTIETRVQGSTTTASTVVDRPALSGSFETVEKRSAVTEGTDTNQRTTESVYRRNPSGGFQEAARSTITSAKANDTTTDTTANYKPGMNGQMQLYAQTESTTTKQPDGKELIQTNLYSQTVAGRLQESNAAMRVKEQQIIERRTNADGSVVETLSIRRPSMSDPAKLGELQKVSETVCQGKCQPDKAPAAPEPTKSASGNSRP